MGQAKLRVKVEGKPSWEQLQRGLRRLIEDVKRAAAERNARVRRA